MKNSTVGILVACVAATAARADVIRYTYSGHITSEQDANTGAGLYFEPIPPGSTFTGCLSYDSASAQTDYIPGSSLALYYDSFVAAGERPTENALDALFYAVDVAPRDPELRFTAVRALIVDNELKDAMELFAPVAYQPHLERDMHDLASRIMTAMTNRPKTTSWPCAEPINGAEAEMFGRSAMKAAPARTPQSDPRPAIAAPTRILSESVTLNSLGWAKPFVSSTRSAPATPASAAEMPNASVL